MPWRWVNLFLSPSLTMLLLVNGSFGGVKAIAGWMGGGSNLSRPAESPSGCCCCKCREKSCAVSESALSNSSDEIPLAPFCPDCPFGRPCPKDCPLRVTVKIPCCLGAAAEASVSILCVGPSQCETALLLPPAPPNQLFHPPRA